jgi:CHAT domain-containing protein
VVFESLGNYEKALDYYNNALNIAKETEDKTREGHILVNLGTLNQNTGKYVEAIDYYNQSLTIANEIQDIQTLWETHAGLGEVFEAQNNSQQAIYHYNKAIALYDSVKANLGIASLGSGFLEYNVNVYPVIVQLLAEKGNYREAFTYAEKYKARTLLDILSQAQAHLKGLLPDTLGNRISDIQSQIEETHAGLSEERSKPEKDQDKILSLDQQVTDLELQKASLMEQVKRDYGAYYHLTASEPLSVSEIQSRILREGQALIEYLVGDKKLSIFVITSDSLFYQSINIGKNSLKQMLGNLSPIFRQEKAPDEESRQQIFSPQLADFSIPPAYDLYNALIKPLEPSLHGVEELIIVPDDILFYLPFEMLVYDVSGIETAYDFANAKFLLEKYAVSYASSASLLNPGLQRPRESRDDILAFGNPDFGAPAEESETTELLASNLRYAGSVVRGGSLVSLPHAETEVKVIGEEFRGTVFTGTKATEENFKAKAQEYSILHFATHFLTNEDHPLYSKIVLAQNNGPEDGYLQTYEVFNLNLNADLAVLSACNTGLGKLQRGEGLVGISRAFLYAGVPSLVVSLWSIDDESTATIMKNFYQHLRAGLNKKQALRLAKIDYLKSSQNVGKDPFYWAPYILIGDWHSIHLPARSSLSRWTIFFVVAISVLIAVLFIRRRKRLSQQ